MFLCPPSHCPPWNCGISPGHPEDKGASEKPENVFFFSDAHRGSAILAP